MTFFIFNKKMSWETLPRPAVAQILSQLSYWDRINCQMINKHWFSCSRQTKWTFQSNLTLVLEVEENTSLRQIEYRHQYSPKIKYVKDDKSSFHNTKIEDPVLHGNLVYTQIKLSWCNRLEHFLVRFINTLIER